MDARGKRLRADEQDEGTKDMAYKVDPRFFEALVYTKVEQLRVPGNTVFIAERTDRVVDVFKGLVRYNFLSVPILQKTGRKYYGFLDMADIVHYVVESFGAGKLEATQDFWQLIDKEEEFREKTVKDVMKYPVAFRNRFHPVQNGYSLLAALEILARERAGLDNTTAASTECLIVNCSPLPVMRTQC